MDSNKRTKEATSGSIQTVGKIAQDFDKSKNELYFEKRMEIFEKALERQNQLISNHAKPEITITLKDGKQLKGQAFVTTPEEIAKKISKNLAEKSIVAKIVYSKKYDMGFGELVAADDDLEEETVNINEEKKENFELFDMHRPLEGDCTLELFDFEQPQGQQTFWHSSAHILGLALERVYGAHLCIGPPLSSGFYYDSYIGNSKVKEEDYGTIEETVEKILKEKLNFQRVALKKEEALEMFGENPFKAQLIQNKVPEGAFTTVYRCGKLIDLCTGPHVQNTIKVKAFKVVKNSSAYWLGNKDNDDLQRVYGISFPRKLQLDEYIQRQEDLKKRDHRLLGKTNNLFDFHHFSPGCAFFFPAGAYIYNKLIEMLRHQYRIRGYQEVITPNLYDSHLWKVSGHWAKYKENMFLVQEEGDEIHGFKPMNCPGHCLMFDMRSVSYKQLPIRMADFGVLHRNELKGALGGLTRVRRFQQDDAHIFCRMDQIQEEIINQLDFVDYVYSLFGFTYELGLSTRPENYLGEIKVWDDAEEALKQALIKFGRPFKINPKDGAFYGPKIDIDLFDAFQRKFQCGTIQLDFQLPIRFNLQYRTAEVVNTKDSKLQSIQEESSEKVPLLKEEEQILEQIVQQVEDGQKVTSDFKDVLRVKKLSSDQADMMLKKMSQDEILDNNAANKRTVSYLTNSSDKALKEKKYTIEEHHLKPGMARPVIVHRAVLGSLERFIAILTEQTGGRWPFWLSPKQIIIVTVSDKYIEFAKKIQNRLVFEGYTAHIDETQDSLSKKVRNAVINNYNYIGTVGQEEVDNGFITITEKHPTKKDATKEVDKMTVRELIAMFKTMEPVMSKKEQELREKSYFRERVREFEGYNNELQYQTFLEGEGIEYGDRDRKIFALIKDRVIDKIKYPNFHRWFQLISTVYQGEDLKGLNKKLLYAVYLGGDEMTQEDRDTYTRLTLEDIDREQYPNLWRWYHFMQKQEPKKEEEKPHCHGNTHTHDHQQQKNKSSSNKPE